MAREQIIEIVDLLDQPDVDAEDVRAFFGSRGYDAVEIETTETESGLVDFLSFEFHGSNGGESPTTGIVGLSEMDLIECKQKGISSYECGVLATLSAALVLVDMGEDESNLYGNVLLKTEMVRPKLDAGKVWLAVESRCERLVDPTMDFVLSLGTVRDSRTNNSAGVAFSPTIKDGWVLPVSEDLVSIKNEVASCPTAVLPVTTQDITPYANELYHLSCVTQPATVTDAPVVAIAFTSGTRVAGKDISPVSAEEIDTAVRFVLEATKAYTSGCLKLFDPEEFDRLVRLYGTMSYLQAPRRVR